MKSLYDTDLYAWALQNAALVRERRFEEADLENIAEELDGLARGERRQLENTLIILIAHLLRSQLRADSPGRSWWLTIREQRRQVDSVLEDNPSLRPTVPEAIRTVYPDAAEKAADEMLLDANPFPVECPFTPAQILDRDWFPVPPAQS